MLRLKAKKFNNDKNEACKIKAIKLWLSYKTVITNIIQERKMSFFGKINNYVIISIIRDS